MHKQRGNYTIRTQGTIIGRSSLQKIKLQLKFITSVACT